MKQILSTSLKEQLQLIAIKLFVITVLAGILGLLVAYLINGMYMPEYNVSVEGRAYIMQTLYVPMTWHYGLLGFGVGVVYILLSLIKPIALTISAICVLSIITLLLGNAELNALESEPVNLLHSYILNVLFFGIISFVGRRIYLWIQSKRRPLATG